MENKMTDYSRFMEFLKQAKITKFIALHGSECKGNDYGTTLILDPGNNRGGVNFCFDSKGKFLYLS